MPAQGPALGNVWNDPVVCAARARRPVRHEGVRNPALRLRVKPLLQHGVEASSTKESEPGQIDPIMPSNAGGSGCAHHGMVAPLIKRLAAGDSLFGQEQALRFLRKHGDAKPPLQSGQEFPRMKLEAKSFEREGIQPVSAI